MKGLNLSKFKKIASDDDFTTMRHYEGHEIKVAHKKLSKAHKSQLEALPMAKGGEVPAKGPWVNPDSAKAIEAGATGRKSTPVKDEATPGVVSSVPLTAETASKDPDAAKAASFEKQKAAFNARLNQPVQNYAEGTPEEPVRDIDLADRELPEIDLATTPGEQIPAIEMMPQAAPEDVPFLQEMGHRAGAGLRGGIQGVAGALGDAAAFIGKPVMNAAQGVVQGASGQPLAPVPTVEGAGPMPERASAGTPTPAPAPAPEQPMPQAPAASSVGDKLISAINTQTAAEAVALQEQAKTSRKLSEQYQMDYNKIAQERATIMADYKQDKIDPNHFWDSQSTAGKIGTILGLVVGGLGGQDAARYLDAQIDRDIDMQKANLGKKQSLLDYNMKSMNSLKDAMEMTRIMQMDLVKDKLALAAADAGDPVRKAKVLEDVANYQAKIDDRAAKLAAQRTLSQAMDTVKKDPSKTQSVVEAVRAADPKVGEELAERATPYGFANTKDGAKTLREAGAANEKTQAGIKRLIEISKVPFKSLSPEARAEAQTIQSEMMGPLRTIMGLGTLSEGDKKLLENMVRNPTSVFSLDRTNRKSLETLSGRMNAGVAAAAKANGLSVPEYKTMGGVNYRKVPGGWQKVQ